MTSIAWIRHAPKQHRNGYGEIRHDSPLADGAAEEIRRVTTLLIRRTGGVPDLIVTSPFLRTRQTALQMMAYLPTTRKPPLIIDRDIEEYLGYQKPAGEKAAVDPSTHKHTQPVLGESLTSLQSRVRRHVEEMRKYTHHRRIWVITHGLVMQTISSVINPSRVVRNIQYLSSLFLNNMTENNLEVIPWRQVDNRSYRTLRPMAHFSGTDRSRALHSRVTVTEIADPVDALTITLTSTAI